MTNSIDATISLSQNQSHEEQISTKLILFDHDGTLCQTNSSAYTSLKAAAKTACEQLSIEYTLTDGDWEAIFSQTRGTTEKVLAKVLAIRLQADIKSFCRFEDLFFKSRANWYKNMQSYQENTYDTYYPDSEQLIHLAMHNKSIVGMITGNPRAVVEERLAIHLKPYFQQDGEQIWGGFGDESEKRHELIINTVAKSSNTLGFKPISNKFGFYDNVYYIGDSRSDFFEGIRSKVKTIWIPSRTFQDVKDVNTQDYIKCLEDLIPEQFIITNNLISKEALQFIGL